METKTDKDINLNDVSTAIGYELETRVQDRFANGWGGTQTRLPSGHLARRDAKPTVKKGGANRR